MSKGERDKGGDRRETQGAGRAEAPRPGEGVQISDLVGQDFSETEESWAPGTFHSEEMSEEGYKKCGKLQIFPFNELTLLLPKIIMIYKCVFTR